MSHIFDEFILYYAINLEKTFEKNNEYYYKINSSWKNFCNMLQFFVMRIKIFAGYLNIFFTTAKLYCLKIGSSGLLAAVSPR